MPTKDKERIEDEKADIEFYESRERWLDYYLEKLREQVYYLYESNNISNPSLGL